MKKIKLLIIIALYGVCPNSVLAGGLDDAEINRQIQNLTQQREAIDIEINSLRSQLLQRQENTPATSGILPYQTLQVPVVAEDVRPRKDYAWLLNCAQNSEENLDAELTYEWFTKMETTHPCDKETVEYLTQPVLMVDIVQGLKSLTKDADCRQRIPELIKDASSWKSTFNHLQDTDQCSPSTKSIIEEYAVQSSVGVYVRENPLLGTRSNSLAKLSPGHRLQLLRRIRGANNEEWGEFRYKRNKETHTGWISMQYTRALK